MDTEKIIINRYKIISEIGRGGMGITYLGRDLETNEEVAIKKLSFFNLDDWKKLDLFKREAKILQQLVNPSIPKYLDYFEVDEAGDLTFYLVQELALGKSLATLKEEGWLPDESMVKNIAKQILDILVYLQSQNPPIIHRDIKPQNIICNFSENTNNLQVYLVDFGAVQDSYQKVTGNTVVGTYGYMAPEQFRGKAFLSTDLYGLGTTLIFVLTGKLPVEFPQKKLKIQLRRRYVKVSKHFYQWINKLIEPSPKDRFSSSLEALNELQNPKIDLRNYFSKDFIDVTLMIFMILWFSCMTLYSLVLYFALGTPVGFIYLIGAFIGIFLFDREKKSYRAYLLNGVGFYVIGIFLFPLLPIATVYISSYLYDLPLWGFWLIVEVAIGIVVAMVNFFKEGNWADKFLDILNGFMSMNVSLLLWIIFGVLFGLGLWTKKI